MAQLDLFNFNNQEVPSTSYQRKEFDRYDSPLWFATTLLEKVGITGTVLECCVGGGAISDVLKASPKVKQVLTNDIDERVGSDFHLDATHAESWDKFPPISWVITNPPFDILTGLKPR